MNKLASHLAVHALLVGAIAVGCTPSGAGGDTSAASVADFALTIAGGAMTMKAGESVQLHAAPVGSGGQAFTGLFTLAWTSDAPTVASVTADGVVTALADGAATIKATATELDTGAVASSSVAVTVGAGASGANGASASGPANESTAAPTSKTFGPMSASATALPNPERGWATWSGSDFVTSYDAGSVASAKSQGHRLSSCTVSLAAYRSQALPGSFLANLTTSFGKIRSAGMKCAMLFEYDGTAGGNDAPASQIKGHLAQLKPVLQANADVIAFTKAGFIGAWGEWHSSQNGNSCGYNSGTTPCSEANANRLVVRDALLDAFHPNTIVQFRYPTDNLLWYPTVLSSGAAFNGSSQARVGAHNDCFLGGSNDSGTYTASNQRAYVAALTDFTPYGGETSASCATPQRTSCSDIQSEGATYHLTWFKGPGSDIAAWTNAWTAGGCATTVQNSMGYRLQIDKVTHQSAAARGSAITVEVDLRNVGWARVMFPRKLQVVLVNGGTTYVAEADSDLRALAAQASTSSAVPIHFTVPAGAPTGSYDVALRIPDVWPSTAANADYAIRFANADDSAQGQAWNAASFRFSTGTKLTVE